MQAFSKYGWFNIDFLSQINQNNLYFFKLLHLNSKLI